MTSQYFRRYLKGAWNKFQVGILLFPLLPLGGAILIFLSGIQSWRKNYHSLIQNRINQGLGILSLLFILTACLAQNPIDAFLGLGNFLPYFWIFAGLTALIQSPHQLKTLSWLLVLPSVPVVVLGLGQQFLGWSGIDSLQGILGWKLALGGNPPGRMSSVFMYANIFAAYLVIVFSLNLGLIINEWQKIKLKKFSSYSPIIYLGIAGVLNAIALILTNSRNAWGLAVLIALAYAVYLGWNWLLGVVSAAITMVLGAAFAPTPLQDSLRIIVPAYFWQRLTDQNFDRPVETLRITQWKFAANLIQQRPLTGWGLRNFTALYEAKMNVWMGHPHNVFLMLGAETGIITTLFFCALVGWILAKAMFRFCQNFSTLKEPMICLSYLVAFIACIGFNLFDVTLFDFRVNTLGWVLLAALNNSNRWD